MTTSLAGMSVNERMDARGFTEQWDGAVHARDRSAMLMLLRRVAMPNPDLVINAILADPAAYGF